ncbi:MAG: folate-binding protein [Methylophilaceae bacterium]|nr:folate-binding protein [Methylophilaceae bacterium]
MQKYKNSILDLKQLSVISVSGNDALLFLQGQLTNDLSLATLTQSIYAGFCNPKGRLLALFHVVRYQDSYLLFLPTSIAENIIKKLSMYILRSDVSLQLNPDRLMYFGLYTDNLASQLSLLNNSPKNEMESVNIESLIVTKLYSDGLRLIIVGDKRNCMDFIKNNSDELEKKDFNVWVAQNIKSGIPNIYNETQEAFIPQSINLDIIGAINFKKGCYTGQEIVARTHYLGKPKRRMYIASFQSASEPLYGNSILNNKDSVGQVVDAAHTSNNNFVLLIEIRIDSDLNNLTLNGIDVDISKSEKNKFSLS